MRNFCIIRNSTKDPKDVVTKEIVAYLQKKGAVCTIADNDSDLDETAECILVLGGDGTMLRAAKRAVGRQIPLIGINLGTLGYLAEIDRERLIPALDSLILDEFTVESRMMLTGIIYHEGKPVYSDIALNDIAISREGNPRVINFKNYVNDLYLTDYQADAIIISTPTGSTGYSLSAGGPIVSPTARLLLMTPLAPHTLNARSIIFAANDRIKVKIGEGRVVQPEKARVDFDGSVGYQVVTGDEIVVTRSVSQTKIIKIKQESFLETLRRKLSDN